ncbi:type I-C CRISPR-associated protein Cas8c/Csd1 [Actinomadura syzygii]|uniref:Type I-C CRISPR-associated protein Cas8c/Csd1 n=1 Tax=Actinomadura syzygii TaxID=1427538 RepID=A0A5D0TXH6_9ACTN|nr:type I-C CRISPR-associated protein Cas8c/Csd1 [Actinomadura syzygii]TYC10066.1 type I-C CRISPR-associated protein Cas8c/Csd1 [Actinomadura syzygii]
MLIGSLVDDVRRQGIGDRIPPYYRMRTVHWAIWIDQQGEGRLIPLVNADDKPGIPEICPSLTRTSGIAPMLLVDTLEYVFAVAKEDTAKAQAGAERRNDAYLKLLADWRESTADPLARTVSEFFGQERHLDLLAELPESPQASELVAVMVGKTWAHRSTAAVDFWADVARARKGSGNEGICLACGKVGSLLKTVPDMVKGPLIPVGIDANGRPKRGRNAALVSVNTPAQGRGGSVQLVNTPLCEDCGEQAIAALNRLLSDERHRLRGDDSVLTWWLREPDDFDVMMIEHPEPVDVRALLAEPWRGLTGTVADTNAFYALTLSANQSRVVVRDWIDMPVIEVKRHLAAWFRDHSSSDRWRDGHHYVPLWQMVRATGRWDRGKKQYVSGSSIRGLARDLFRAALRGTPAPPHLIPRLLHHIRNDHHVDLARVALLRLALTRPPYQEKVMPGLDENFNDTAYVWGRLFAVLESIQRRALPDVNATIRDRYFGLAMTQPEATMRMLRTNANGHIKKLVRRDETRGAGYALDSRLAELSQLIEPRVGLPLVLDAPGQTRFILGYDHQRAADMAAARAATEAKKSGGQPGGALTTTNQEPS